MTFVISHFCFALGLENIIQHPGGVLINSGLTELIPLFSSLAEENENESLPALPVNRGIRYPRFCFTLGRENKIQHQLNPKMYRISSQYTLHKFFTEVKIYA